MSQIGAYLYFQHGDRATIQKSRNKSLLQLAKTYFFIANTTKRRHKNNALSGLENYVLSRFMDGFHKKKMIQSPLTMDQSLLLHLNLSLSLTFSHRTILKILKQSTNIQTSNLYNSFILNKQEATASIANFH